MSEEKRIDFLAIGDIVNDDFIDLEKGVKVYEDKEGVQQLDIRFGDKIPYLDRLLVRAVGNSPNAAMSATRLGLNTGLMTHIGNDELGDKTMQTLGERGINTDFVTVEEGKQTNYHFVLRYHAERTILIKHEAYNYDLQKQVQEKTLPNWVYFSSVGEDSMQYHHDIATWVKENDIKMSFQPGTFQIRLGYEKLRDIYEASEIFFCNVEEAIRILEPVIGKEKIEENRKSEKREDLVSFLIKEMKNLGPNIVCITDGPDGAYAYEGEAVYFIPSYPDPAKPVDRTGAGDAFSSTFTSALALGENIQTALTWGPINSMSVVQYVGAQKGLLSREKLLEYLTSAPEDYKVRELS